VHPPLDAGGIGSGDVGLNQDLLPLVEGSDSSEDLGSVVRRGEVHSVESLLKASRNVSSAANPPREAFEKDKVTNSRIIGKSDGSRGTLSVAGRAELGRRLGVDGLVESVEDDGVLTLGSLSVVEPSFGVLSLRKERNRKGRRQVSYNTIWKRASEKGEKRTSEKK
jgi:hypothetical protein